jgi:hypothetical protein
LSEDTRAFYFDLKRTIKEIFDSKKYQENELLVETDSAGLLNKASLLRASLTKDVGTRKSSPIMDT